MTTQAPTPITWWDDDPARKQSECSTMADAAPDLEWFAEGLAGWSGEVPLWPFARARPHGLTRLVHERRLSVTVICWPAHPMMAPLVEPHGVELPSEALGWNAWHLLSNGALCLFRGAAWWDPARTAASLVPKISGWYIEYHLMKRGCIERMPDRGVDLDDALDDLIDKCADSTA